MIVEMIMYNLTGIVLFIYLGLDSIFIGSKNEFYYCGGAVIAFILNIFFLLVIMFLKRNKKIKNDSEVMYGKGN